MSAVIQRSLRRLWRWLGSTEAKVRCSVCGREVSVAGNVARGSGAFPTAIPRPVEEIVAACRQQHGTNHSHVEVVEAKERRRLQTGS